MCVQLLLLKQNAIRTYTSMSPPDDPVPTFNWVFKNQPMAQILLTQPSRYKKKSRKQIADRGKRSLTGGFRQLVVQLYIYIYKYNIRTMKFQIPTWQHRTEPGGVPSKAYETPKKTFCLKIKLIKIKIYLSQNVKQIHELLQKVKLVVWC